MQDATSAHVCTQQRWDTAGMPQEAASAHVCTPKYPNEYLRGLPAWDGVRRLDAWLPHVLGESPQSVGMHRMQYLTLVGRQWVLGMVRRVQLRGCKFDYYLYLEGAGGTGKSSLLAALAGDEFFSDTPNAMSWGAAPVVEIQGVWLYEICELDALSKADKAAIKGFITTRTDPCRPKYAHDKHFFPRQFLVACTSNNTKWRAADDGRGCWVVPVRNQINTKWVTEHRDQLFAEALTRAKEADDMQDLGFHPGNPLQERQ